MDNDNKGFISTNDIIRVLTGGVQQDDKKKQININNEQIKNKVESPNTILEDKSIVYVKHKQHENSNSGGHIVVSSNGKEISYSNSVVMSDDSKSFHLPSSIYKTSRILSTIREFSLRTRMADQSKKIESNTIPLIFVCRVRQKEKD